MLRRCLAALAAFAALLAAAGLSADARAATPWPIDHAHSKVTFTVTKWGFVEVEGRFRDFRGTILYDADHPERSRVDWRVQVASVDTGEADRNRALQRPEYFDAARNPEMRFVSTSVRRLEEDRLEVTGTITIRGIAKPLTVEVAYRGRHEVPDLGPMDLFQTRFTINRLDFGMVGGSLLGPVISRDAEVTLIAAARPPA